MNLPLQQKLSACPFCGAGTTTIRENGRMWSARGLSEPSSISIMHWCEPIAGQPSRVIDRVGRDLESAIAAWEMRSPASVEVTDAQILHRWDTHVGEPTTELPLTNVDKIRFARAILKLAAPTSGTASDAAARNAALDEAAKACKAEEVDASTDSDGDRAYNLAIEHCIDSIAALKVEVPTHG